MNYYIEDCTQERFIYLLERYFSEFKSIFNAQYRFKQVSTDKYIAQRKFSVGANLLQNSFEPDIHIKVQRFNSDLKIEFSFKYSTIVNIIFRVAALILLYFTYILIELYSGRSLNLVQFTFGIGLIIFTLIFVLLMNKKSKDSSAKKIDEEFMCQFKKSKG
ncbi:MAG: hypothetical protein IJD81_02690 [Oscillospiraceae bacterium]|nr:hypothetical protein [Oscillospiraceae bacterium]